MRRLALALLLALGTVQAASVTVQVGHVPGLTFSRQASSVAMLETPWGQQAGKLSGGLLYAADPQHYWASLKPLDLKVNVPPGTPAGSYPVSVSTTLYVCDQKIHLCSVRPAQTRGQLTVGPQAVPLTLTLEVPGLRSF